MCDNKIDSCSKRLLHAMAIRKMKQSELCKQAGVPKSSLSLYLSGAYEPKQDRVYRMASVLHVSETWLMGYDVPMEREMNTISAIGLKKNEQVMLDLFRQVPENQQNVLIQMLHDGLSIKR